MVRGIYISAALAFVSCCILGTSARPQNALRDGSSPSTPLVKSDSCFISVRIDERNLLTHRFEENTLRSLGSCFALRPNPWLGVEPFELSKFQCGLFGADTGLTLGLLGAALGMTAGLWDEDTAWYIAAAATALGAAQGISKANEPDFRIRWRWQDSR